MVKTTLKKPLTLLEAIMELFHGVSKQKARQIIRYSDIYVNGKAVEKKPNTLLNQGDLIEAVKTGAVKNTFRKPSHDHPVVFHYEDDFLLVAHKPAGILSCANATEPGARNFKKLVEEYLLERDQKKERQFIVHRLDREVEGMIIFAKSEMIKDRLKDSWDGVIKKYLALVEGKPEQNEGIIESWLKDTPSQKVESFNKEVSGSRLAKTGYRVLKSDGKYSLIEIVLHTGRKNQIRVHMGQLGCPIVGDRKYGADASVVRQIRLAACKLSFPHPVHQKPIELSYTPGAGFVKPSGNTDEKYKII